MAHQSRQLGEADANIAVIVSKQAEESKSGKKSRARNKKKDRNCYRCGERGHMARDCFAGRLQKVLKLFQHASRKKSQNKKSQRSN